MRLIPVNMKTAVHAICPDCRQLVLRAERDDGTAVVFSGDPSGYRLTKNAKGDLIDHFDAAELHGCLK